MTSGRLPLSRFKVLDLTHARAGPTAVRHLADWGAQVIKIERPSSEQREGLGGARNGFDFQNLHRNKRSMTLDLKSEAGKAIFFRLAEHADVIVENMRAAVKHRLGIDYEAVRKVNPRIVYGSISGFGQDGPYGKRAGVDQIAQGMGGLMSITGLPGQGPVRVGIPIADLTAGGFLAQGILIALLDREVTGEGRWVHTSLLEAQIAMLDFQATRWLIKGEIPPQAGNDHPTGIPTGLFPTVDGQINIAASGQGIWERFCRTMKLEHFISDPRFAASEARSKNRHELNALIAEATKGRKSEELIVLLNEAGVPCGPVYTIDKVFADPQVTHLGIAQPLEHPKLGRLNLVAQPNNLSGVSKAFRAPTPELGEHTGEVLREIGCSDAEIAGLRDKRVI
jgi:crotonobetainyl-CoA:carnitine CoA-transferase CaiB-like acyl-CoA transferase